MDLNIDVGLEQYDDAPQPPQAPTMVNQGENVFSTRGRFKRNILKDRIRSYVTNTYKNLREGRVLTINAINNSVIADIPLIRQNEIRRGVIDYAVGDTDAEHFSLSSKQVDAIKANTRKLQSTEHGRLISKMLYGEKKGSGLGRIISQYPKSVLYNRSRVNKAVGSGF